VDTIIFVITIVCASLMVALLFITGVLSYKWSNSPLIEISATANKMGMEGAIDR
jgi:hypothetical protein